MSRRCAFGHLQQLHQPGLVAITVCSYRGRVETHTAHWLRSSRVYGVHRMFARDLRLVHVING